LLHDVSIKNVIVYLTLVLVLVFIPDISAQWVSNPGKNTLLVTNSFNPVNISAVDDHRGGLFIFWEDNISGFQGEISFLHVNGDGIVSFRTDGKKVSASETPKYNPLSVAGIPGSAYVVWRERLRSYSDQLFAQRVSTSGNLTWNQNGIPVNNSGLVISDFTACSDKSGNLFVAYVNGEPDNHGKYSITVNGVNQGGGKLFYNDIVIAVTGNKKSNLSLVEDADGGVQVFWLESIDHRSVLLGQSIDLSGKVRWGQKPVTFSNPRENLFSFTAKKFNSSVYLVWQSQKSVKDLYHQLIGRDGKELWPKYGTLIFPHKGNQTNPQVHISEDKIFLAWTDDSSVDRDIILQKFNAKGEALWDRNGIKVIESRGEQFGQKIVSDGKNGVLIIWLDRRVTGTRGNIYAQRINADGKLLWDEKGIEAASYNNTEKSYISIIPDNTGGAAVVFKEKRNGRNEIFGHKIYNTGTFTSQIIAFNTELQGDSVKVSWYSANEITGSSFWIERTLSDDEDIWEKVGEINSDGKAAAKYYEYYDRPGKTGTIYYRVIQSDQNGNIQPSDLAKINYFGENISIYVAQNSPNPFKDNTKISIYLPQPEKVRIEFFDSRIEKISELMKDLPAGLSEIEFSASALNPGIYFYKVHAKDFVDVKKMVVTNE
jgi:hypothetical protein